MPRIRPQRKVPRKPLEKVSTRVLIPMNSESLKKKELRKADTAPETWGHAYNPQYW